MKKFSLVAGIVMTSTVLHAAGLPNVVILYADDMGYGDLAANGCSTKIPTPNLDELAAGGMRFTDGHSSSGICTPSRFALLTGQHHWRRFHGIVDSFGESVFRPDDFTLAKMFKSKGYRTAAIGKWHLGWDWEAYKKPGTPKLTKERPGEPGDFDWTKPIAGGPLAQGFDYYFGDGTINFPPYCFIENDRVVEAPTVMKDTDAFRPIPEGNWEFRPGPMVEGWDPFKVLPTLTEKAVQWIGGQKAEQPFFLYMAFPSPHAPIIPNDEFRGKSEAGAYGDFVFETDAMAGRILDALEAGGFSENTIVVFTADNGAEKYAYNRQKNFGHWSSGKFRGLKRDLWEGGHHVPFVIRWPGAVPAGAVSDEVINQVDLAATFAGIIGYDLNPAEAVDSYDLVPLLKGGEYAKPLRKATVQNTYSKRYALRQGDWVFINTDTGQHSASPDWYNEENGYSKESTPGLLYNLKEDPAQKDNLYSKYPERVAQMEALLNQYIGGIPCAPHAIRQDKPVDE